MKPIVAIIGRPNVGKSTFFNRVTRTRNALVDDFPGVTRDRHYGDASWGGVEFTLVDTGGFLEEDESGFADEIRFQILQAIEDADVIVLLLDGKHGISPFDEDVVKILRELQEFSQNKLAELTGIPQSTISAIENDRVRLGVERSKILARALSCHPAVLVFPSWDIAVESAA